MAQLHRNTAQIPSLFRRLVLGVAVGCTSFGIVSIFMSNPAGSLLYLVGFPLLCVVLFS